MDANELVSSRTGLLPRARKRFTVEEANRALLLVRRITADIVAEFRELQRWERRDNELTGRRQVTEEQLQESRQEHDGHMKRLVELIEELEGLGLELKDSGVGLVDFRAIHDGREVYLCWKLGEARVAHWHELGAGFAGRRPIDESFRGHR